MYTVVVFYAEGDALAYTDMTRDSAEGFVIWARNNRQFHVTQIMIVPQASTVGLGIGDSDV